MTVLDPHALGMAPHPEGGWYRRLWAHEQQIATPGGPRPLATCVSFLLRPGDVSAWHKVTSPELWLWQGGGEVRVTLGGTEKAPVAADSAVLGVGGSFLVPAGAWQTAEPVADAVLVACVVSPGFDFADFTLHEDDRTAAGRRENTAPSVWGE